MAHTRFGSALLIVFASGFGSSQLPAVDYVTIRQGEKQRELTGKIEVEAVDGGVMVLARDGGLWPIEKENLVSRRSDPKTFVPFTREELARQLAAELPGFKAH